MGPEGDRSCAHRTIVFQDVSDNVGMQMCNFLRPKDVFSLGSCSRDLRRDLVNVNLARICTQVLPLQLGRGSNYLAEFREGCSFFNKEDLLNHVLDKTEMANLVLVGTESLTESRRQAKEVLLNGHDLKSTAKFHVQCDLNNQHSITTATPVTVECRYQRGIGKQFAKSWATYIVDRDACKRNGADKETYQLVQEWLNCLFSRSDNNVTFGTWRWSCKHRDLNGHGIAGVGVFMTITAPGLFVEDTERASDDCTSVIEVRLTRKY